VQLYSQLYQYRTVILGVVSLMGPSRKKPRTEPPSVEESPTAPSGESCPPTPPKPIDPTTNDTDGITKSAEATASPLKAPIKSEGSQTRQVSHQVHRHQMYKIQGCELTFRYRLNQRVLGTVHGPGNRSLQHQWLARLYWQTSQRMALQQI